MPPSWLTGKTNELDITKQSESRPANGGRLAKNLWSQLTLTRRAPPIRSQAEVSRLCIGKASEEKLQIGTKMTYGSFDLTDFVYPLPTPVEVTDSLYAVCNPCALVGAGY
jgi:hypothetical protein